MNLTRAAPPMCMNLTRAQPLQALSWRFSGFLSPLDHLHRRTDMPSELCMLKARVLPLASKDNKLEDTGLIDADVNNGEKLSYICEVKKSGKTILKTNYLTKIEK